MDEYYLSVFIYMSSAETESGGDATYDLMTVAAVNTSTSALDGLTIMKMNFWIHAILIKMIPCLLLTLFGCLLVSTVRASHRTSHRARIGPRLSKAGNRRLAERNRTTVRQQGRSKTWSERSEWLTVGAVCAKRSNRLDHVWEDKAIRQAFIKTHL